MILRMTPEQAEAHQRRLAGARVVRPMGEEKPEPKPVAFKDASLGRLATDLDAFGFLAVSEHRVHPERKWRFDLAIVDDLVALEMDGGVWTEGRHTRPQGFLNDLEKLNEATILGWRVIRATPDQVDKGVALKLMLRLLEAKR